MKKRVFIFGIILMIIGGIAYSYIVNYTEETVSQKSEYIPEAEITDEDLRKTIITLYFANSQTQKLESEGRLIDSKELLREPYKVLIGMLIEGPKDSNLERLIPDNTKVINTELKGSCLNINLSKDFLEIDDANPTKISNLIYSIVNTLTELKEVSSVKFLVDSEECDKFLNCGIDIKAEFIRKE